MAQSEEHIKELPTITFCFHKPELGKTSYEYGFDFKIKHILKIGDDAESAILIEGNSTLLGGIVSLNKIISDPMGNCYKISYKFKNPYNYKFSDFLVYFNQSIPQRDIPKLNAFFTSEKNVYGIAQRVWKNGKVAKVEVDKSFRKIVDLFLRNLYIWKQKIQNVVGGTLGMCIGFSFTGILSSFMRLLNLRINVHT